MNLHFFLHSIPESNGSNLFEDKMFYIILNACESMVNVAIVGYGTTKFGKRNDVNYRELLVEAAHTAFKSTTEISPDDIQGLYIASSMPELTVQQANVANLAAELLGLHPKIAARIEIACSSGSSAVRNAWAAIKAGLIDTAIVIGIEKMYEDLKGANLGLSIVPDVTFESLQGITAYSGFALSAQQHMHQYGTTHEQLSLVAVKNHANAARNPLAHFYELGEISLDKAMNARIVADPLTLFDCSPLSDGAAAVILTRGDLARKFTDKPVWINGSGESMEAAIGVANMQSLTDWVSLKVAAHDAYSMANIAAASIDVAEVHDCFTIAEIIEYELLGFTKIGKGGLLIEQGETELTGSIPVNPSGGLKAKGHPVGATGVAQLCELAGQLNGEAGVRQVPDARVGLAHNLSGFATHHIVHILSKEETL